MNPSGGGSGGRFGQGLFRVGSDGAEEAAGSGWPVLLDKAGNLWTKQTWQSGENAYEVCSDKARPVSVYVPGADWATALVSDRPGSVYAWTDFALYHLSAEDPLHPSRFAVRGAVFPTGFRGVPVGQGVHFALPGAVAVETRLPWEDKFILYVFPLGSAQGQ